MIKLSKTSKIPAKSWSLQAGETCPGAVGSDACAGCYAMTGTYTWHTVKGPRAENKKDWKRNEWVHDMAHAIYKDKFFRWFDSGDMYSLELAMKIYTVMVLTPNTKHWLPTRMYKFPKFHKVLSMMQSLPNVMVRFSSDSVLGQFDSRHGSTILPDADTPAGVTRCMAYTRGGKCGDCRACWDKSVAVVGYPQHGHAMKKVINIRKAA